MRRSNLYVIYLVRDPRGTINSVQVREYMTDPTYITDHMTDHNMDHMTDHIAGNTHNLPTILQTILKTTLQN